MKFRSEVYETLETNSRLADQRRAFSLWNPKLH